MEIQFDNFIYKFVKRTETFLDKIEGSLVAYLL